MTAPRLIGCYFNEQARAGQWPRMASVLAYSAALHAPGWTVDIRAIPAVAPTESWQIPSQVANTQKLEYWSEQVAHAADGDPLLLIDVDTLILRPLDPVWERPFDVAYTTRPSDALFPFNAGVVFVRATPATKAFMAAWAADNARLLLDDPRNRQGWRVKYGGINQASLAHTLQQRAKFTDLTLVTLPCQDWNCEDSCWTRFDETRTRILHIKSSLRREVFQRQTPMAENKHLRPLAARWRELERQLIQAPVRTEALA